MALNAIINAFNPWTDGQLGLQPGPHFTGRAESSGCRELVYELRLYMLLVYQKSRCAVDLH